MKEEFLNLILHWIFYFSCLFLVTKLLARDETTTTTSRLSYCVSRLVPSLKFQPRHWNPIHQYSVVLVRDGLTLNILPSCVTLCRWWIHSHVKYYTCPAKCIQIVVVFWAMARASQYLQNSPTPKMFASCFYTIYRERSRSIEYVAVDLSWFFFLTFRRPPKSLPVLVWEVFIAPAPTASRYKRYGISRDPLHVFFFGLGKCSSYFQDSRRGVAIGISAPALVNSSPAGYIAVVQELE